MNTVLPTLAHLVFWSKIAYCSASALFVALVWTLRSKFGLGFGEQLQGLIGALSKSGEKPEFLKHVPVDRFEAMKIAGMGYLAIGATLLGLLGVSGPQANLFWFMNGFFGIFAVMNVGWSMVMMGRLSHGDGTPA
jgi:hypothetical protein